MARLRFSGPAGAPWAGKVIKVDKNGGCLADMIDLQDELGMTTEQLVERQKTSEPFQTAIVFYMSLRTAGYPVTFAEVLRIRQDDFESIKEPGDRRSKTPADTAPDPTSAPTGSVRGDDEQPAAAAPPAARPKPRSPGSKSRSARAGSSSRTSGRA